MMTAKADKVGGFNPWATAVHAREEARRRGDRRVGTDDLLLGLLREPAVAQVLGCDLGAAREALDAMDRDALVASSACSGPLARRPLYSCARRHERPSVRAFSLTCLRVSLA